MRHTTRFGDVLVLVYRPQEAVYALRLMKISFDEYFTTVADYNRAQFELFHALGYPAQEVTYLRPPGTLEPVDTRGRTTCLQSATDRLRQPVEPLAASGIRRLMYTSRRHL